MHEAVPRGSLLINGKRVMDRQLASLCACTEREIKTLVAELEMAGVFSRDNGIIYSRRMRKDDERAARDRANGRKGGNPKVKGGVNPPVDGGDKAQKPEARSQIGSEASDSDGKPSSDDPQEVGKIIQRPMPDVPLPEEPLEETARVRLWRVGKPALMALGVPEKQCGQMMGLWLKDTGDNHDRVLGAIVRAHEMAPMDPIPWITASLKPDKPNGKTHSLTDAAAALHERLLAAELQDRTLPAELRSGAA
jgi:hypothetical protein